MDFKISTNGFADIIDITQNVSEAIEKSAVNDGICLVFCPGSTAAITTIEYEEGAIADLKRALEKIAPMNSDYQHNKKWGDGNGYAHVRSALFNPSFCCPVENGKPVLGTWQQIVLIDFDNRPRERQIVVKVK